MGVSLPQVVRGEGGGSGGEGSGQDKSSLRKKRCVVVLAVGPPKGD